MTPTPQQLQQAVDNCSRDPIHIPGTIQSFGVLIATDLSMGVIEYLSENVSEAFGIDAGTLIGKTTTTLFSDEELHAFRNALSQENIETQRSLLGNKYLQDQEYQVSLHRQGGRAIVELLPEQRAPADRFRMLEQARGFLTTPLDINALDMFFQEATEQMRALNGFDRVKFYRFLPDSAGEVIAEARHPEMRSFKGLRFPATDIPPIARQLYARTPIRVLSDIEGKDVAILGAPGAEPLDLSLAILRGKDVVHRQYLVNMGVACTETIPVVVDGTLWGLFAAHHMTPKIPDPSALGAAELAGKLIGLRVQHALEAQRQLNLQNCMRVSNRLIVMDDSELAVSDYWTEIRNEMAGLLPCDGVVFKIDDRLKSFGNVPNAAACAAILKLGQQQEAQISEFCDLAAHLPGVDLGTTGGALVIALPGNPSISIIFLRDQVKTSVTWAGRPEKEIVLDQSGPKLNPRNSFESYMEEASERSDQWRAEDLEIARALRNAMAQSLSVQSELRDNRHRLGLMVRELNHRVRNILSLVQALSRQSRTNVKSVEGYADALEKRILALSGAHNLLTRSEMTGAFLDDLVMLELKPFEGSEGRAKVFGPTVSLRPDAASVLALLFHELTSNAAKYGALSVAHGKVSVTWTLEDEGIALHWRETRGPLVTTPTRYGFGRSIIEDALKFELGGRAQLHFLSSGVEAQFWLPGNVINGLSRDQTPTENLAGEELQPDTAPKRGGLLRALVVEDNFVVAMMGKRLLLDEGFAQVDVAASTGEALSYLEQQPYQFCLLDVNLQGELSTPIARHLEKEDIPYVFATGYGSDGNEIVDDHKAIVLEKPIDAKELHDVLNTLVPGADP